MEMERQATQVAGDLADAEVEQVLECIEKYASEKITRLAITTTEDNSHPNYHRPHMSQHRPAHQRFIPQQQHGRHEQSNRQGEGRGRERSSNERGTQYGGNGRAMSARESISSTGPRKLGRQLEINMYPTAGGETNSGTRHNAQHHPPKLRTDRNKSTPGCWRCGNLGHLMRDCTSQPQVRQQSTAAPHHQRVGDRSLPPRAPGRPPPPKTAQPKTCAAAPQLQPRSRGRPRAARGESDRGNRHGESHVCSTATSKRGVHGPWTRTLLRIPPHRSCVHFNQRLILQPPT